MDFKKNKELKSVFAKLLKEYGPQQWWPAKTKFEVIVGAILTQNTNWKNVEKALDNLREKKYLDRKILYAIPEKELARLIKPAGYFNIKAKRLKNFIQFFYEKYQGSLKRMGCEKPDLLRKRLLKVNGIGPETADSILLYAVDAPIFVVDAYTKRIFSRYGLVKEIDDYAAVQRLFTDNLVKNVQMFNEYHALIVKLAKEHCKVNPMCDGCPLENACRKLIFK